MLSTEVDVYQKNQQMHKYETGLPNTNRLMTRCSDSNWTKMKKKINYMLITRMNEWSKYNKDKVQV